jgi:tetratricopeptide (TPR) repeat protein
MEPQQKRERNRIITEACQEAARLAIQRLVFAAIICVVVAYSSTAQTGRDIARDAFPSVVLIVAENSKTGESTLGSGFFVSGDLIVTNYHVVKGASKITVKLVGSEAEHEAEVVAYNAAKDLAILKVDRILARPLSLGDISDVGVGDEVYVIGNPEGLEATMSQGIVSGIRQIEGNRLFQITAAVSHGSSGGPVLGKSGEVIGVAVGSLSSGQNLNFAIPASEIIAILNRSTRLESVPASHSRLPKSTPSSSDSKLDSYSQTEIDKALENERKQPESPTAHFKLAETYFNVGRLDEVLLDNAIQEYKRVIQIDPRFLTAYVGLAEAYQWLSSRRNRDNYLEAAVEANKQAIRINPDFVEAHVGLCKAYSAQSRYDDAVAACRLAIHIKPTFVAAFTNLGDVYRVSKRFDDAVKAYQAASRLEPNSPFHYIGIGEVYQSARRYDLAIVNFQHSIRLFLLNDPNFGGYDMTYERLIECYTASRRFPDGIAYFRRLVSTLGDKRIGSDFEYWSGIKSTLARHALGLLYARSGNKKSALEQYKILKSQGSGYPEGQTARFANELFNEIYK